MLGNHDLHLLALGAGTTHYGERFETLRKILDADDRNELLDWLRHRPLAHYDKSLETLLVHAGVYPTWTVNKTLALRGNDYSGLLANMYGNTPAKWSGKISGYKRLRFIVNCLTRMRMLTPKMRLNLAHNGPPWRGRKNLTPWYDIADPAWAGTRIVFGHWSQLGLIVLPELVSLDTGCVWGRQLTAVRLDKRVPRVIQVEGQRQ